MNGRSILPAPTCPRHRCAQSAVGAVRASFGIGTRVEDVDRLLRALEALRENGPRWRYRAEGTRVVPDPDPRGVPEIPWRDGVRADAQAH